MSEPVSDYSPNRPFVEALPVPLWDAPMRPSRSMIEFIKTHGDAMRPSADEKDDGKPNDFFPPDAMLVLRMQQEIAQRKKLWLDAVK